MKEKFITLIKEVFEMEEEEVNLNDTFRNYDTWDSLTHLSLIAMLDDEYDLQIEDADFQKLTTIDDLFQTVQSK